jgi:HEAT repeat protein
VNAIIAVGDIGTKDPVQARQIVDALLITLNSSQAIVQFQSAQTLGKLAENSERALPELKRSIDRLADAANRNVSWKNQQAYCFALARIAGDKEKGPDRRAILALAGALRDDTMEVRLEAVQGLLMLGTPPDLKDIATMQRIIESRLNPSNANADREPSKTVQVWLRLCLIRVNKAQFMNAKTIGDIAATLNAPELQPRLAAVNALGILESNAKDHVPELVKLLDSEHPELVYAVCVTLGRIGDPRAIPDLEKMNGHKEPLIRFAAKTAIADINGEKKPDPEKAAEKDPKDAKKAGG